MDAPTIIVSIVGSSFFSAIVTAILAPLIQHRLQREDRKRTDEQHRISMREKEMKINQEAFDMLRQASTDFPFLKEYISQMPVGLGQTKVDTGNIDHPIVFVDRKKFGIEISWGPEEWKTMR